MLEENPQNREKPENARAENQSRRGALAILRAATKIPTLALRGAGVRVAAIGTMTILEIEMKIMVVEDEGIIAEDVITSLQKSGYMVDHSTDGEDAWIRGDTENYDAIVLDLGLPSLDGLTILKRWRAAECTTPVIILTVRDNWTERVAGINAGADDYLTKPFVMEELLARLRAVLRRSNGHSSDMISLSSLLLDTRQQSLIIEDTTHLLTSLEYRLVSYFFHHQNRIIPGAELLDHIYGDESLSNGNALEVLVARLRRKLGKEKIKTRRGQGYWMSDTD